MNIDQRIAEELMLKEEQVKAGVRLLDAGATVPFIARYRKEATGGLNDTQLRSLEARLGYLRDLEERRSTILKSIDDQGKLTSELKKKVMEADTRTRLEDLYLPYRPRRRTRAQTAREAGLEPLATVLWEDRRADPEIAAQNYINPDHDIKDAGKALDGARYILMEYISEDADLVGKLREYVWEYGNLESRVVEKKEHEGVKFSDYFLYHEPLKKLPSHRVLALLRGRREGILRLKLKVEGQDDLDAGQGPGICERIISGYYRLDFTGCPADPWLQQTIRWAWGMKLAPHLQTEVLSKLLEQAEEEAVRVFAANLRDLLLAAPAGPRPTIGLDPGYRTGVKVAVVDATGRLVNYTTIYPHAPRVEWTQSVQTLEGLVRKYHIELISIGNGTASRQTERLVSDLKKQHPDLEIESVMVSEAGASVYSASGLAAREFPSLDVSFRGAVSIARRLQDPLAELVKIEPRSIGVGQYQHDVNQTNLAGTLDKVVEDCVNAVGVEVNTASVPLLSRVAGLTGTIAENIVAWRNANGVFRNRTQLREVPRLGPKSFEQCAGFLRIMNGDNPLDASAVHPEAYPVVQRIMAKTGKDITQLIGNTAFLSTLTPDDFTDEQFGVPTVRDIVSELEKPGRDPRPEFRTAFFQEGIEDLGDLETGMLLEGVVTNVTNFGAFVDIGVHQDGLVHISAMCDRFVKNPREVVRVGTVVKVMVMEVDPVRRRISLSMRPSHTQEYMESSQQ
ncbi:MAG: Tex family protein [Spirochaetota bacterium]